MNNEFCADDVVSVSADGTECKTKDGGVHRINREQYEFITNCIPNVVREPFPVPAMQWPQDQPKTMQQAEENTTFKIHASDLRAVLSEWINENLSPELNPYIDELMYRIALRSKVR